MQAKSSDNGRTAHTASELDAHGLLLNAQYDLFKCAAPDAGSPVRRLYWDRIVRACAYVIGEAPLTRETMALSEPLDGTSRSPVDLIARALASTEDREIWESDEIWTCGVLDRLNAQGALTCWMKEDVSALTMALLDQAVAMDAPSPFRTHTQRSGTDDQRGRDTGQARVTGQGYEHRRYDAHGR